MELSSDSGFWEFHQKEVDGGSRVPCRYLGVGEGEEKVEDSETTDLSAMSK